MMAFKCNTRGVEVAGGGRSHQNSPQATYFLSVLGRIQNYCDGRHIMPKSEHKKNQLLALRARIEADSNLNRLIDDMIFASGLLVNDRAFISATFNSEAVSIVQEYIHLNAHALKNATTP